MDQFLINIVSAKSQADKAINSLKGILLGINLDGTVNEKEVGELHHWVLEHKELIGRNPFNEFMTLIESSISNELPQKEAIEDLYWLCQKYEDDGYYYNGFTADLQTLQGLCHGIVSDGIINDDEIEGLNQWLKANEHLNNYYPYDEIRSLILTVVADHKIDDEERQTLKAYFSQFVKLKDKNVFEGLQNEIGGQIISGLCTSEPNVDFENRSFCMTGILQRCSRTELESRISRLGGIVVDSVTKKTDYLIVADHGNPAWAFSCYGRKVEKALQLRKTGHTIMLIHEYDFGDIVDDLI